MPSTPDRSRHMALRSPLARERSSLTLGSTLLRDRQSTEPTEGSRDDSNPFAPPPEGSPDRPWEPRRGAGDDGSGTGEGQSGRGGNGEGTGEGRQGGRGSASGWGQWSSRQPGRSSGGGFGGRPGGQGGPESGGPGTGMRWDPTDPAQRRARYALLAGMWAFFFVLFDLSEIALLLGALALYWGGSSLRAKSRRDASAASAAGMAGGSGAAAGPGTGTQTGGGRPQVTAAVGGMVMAVVALLMVATTFTMQLVYSDFYTCRDDALTKSGQLACNELLPDPLRKVIGVQE
ncbi:hypothetical protein [Streptomyces sp. NPDC127084]|uniref:hypothetical protein n=1 Tax=Streptomyces sp. NPDC127084 TaxID=3347133 RepID=UPI00365B3D39